MEKEKLKKGLKIASIIFTVIKVICVILLILLILVLVMQRVSKNEIAVGGFRIFNVATESMVPKYKVGDIIVIKAIEPSKLKVGDDITYLGEKDTFKDRVVTHQLVEIEENENGTIYHTRGIANPVEDPTIRADQIYGKVIYKCKIISILSKLMNNMTAFYIVIFIPLSILIAVQIIDTFSGKEDSDDDEK